MPENKEFFLHGSRWVRADFHLHTRRDKEFSYSGPEQDFITQYIAALKQTGISAGVITNHNKFDLDEFKSLRKAALKEDVYLLPGIELSVKDGSTGIHTLVIFDEEWIDNKESTDHINCFLTLTFAGQANYETSNARSNHDLFETIRELDKFGKDYFLVFAHVEATAGLWKALDGGRIKELASNESFISRTAAFQKVRTRDSRDKVKAWLNGWYPAEVEGSDPKSIDEIGRGEKTFIKIGAFRYEAVQFALKPAAERLSADTVEEHPHSSIYSIRFEGGILDGQKINLSDQMNCFIGIRGSGKSAILESLRYAIGLRMPDGSDELEVKYKQDLVRFALGSGGKIIIEIHDAAGQLFEVRRIFNEKADVYFEGQLKPGISIPLKNPLFFGQKELVKRGKDAESELIEKLIGSKLDSIRKEIQSQTKRVIDTLANIDKFKDLDTMETEYQNRKKDAEFRLEFFAKNGVEEKLRRQVEFNADIDHVRKRVDLAESFLRTIDAFLSEQEMELGAAQLFSSKENSDIAEEVNKTYNRIQAFPAKIRQDTSEIRKEIQILHDKLTIMEKRKEILKDEFAAIERKLSEQLKQTGFSSVRPDEFVKLNAEMQKANTALDEITKSRSRKNALKDEFVREARKLSELWHREFKEIESEIKKLNETQQALQINAAYKGDKDALLRQLRDQFRGSKLRESTLKTIVDQYPDFISIYESLDSICTSIGESGSVFRKYFSEAKTSLVPWQVPNSFQINYHGKDLREHSLGQRASALILFILSQRDNDVIVIDQPEDDLDNQTIFEDVIKLIRSLKINIQFIFATHNANFPVLGDAEQIGTCAFINGKENINVGSIDNQETQKAIVSIMEGGQEAFARRKEIYHLWKQ